MHFSEIIKLQFEKKKSLTLLCILLLFRIIVDVCQNPVGTMIHLDRIPLFIFSLLYVICYCFEMHR